MEELGRSASDELADRLAASIINGELKPGERLVEADLAAQFDVSRGPVRSALSTLRRLGLVELPSKRGMVVVTLTPSAVRDLYEVRIALERAAVERLTRTPHVEWSSLRERLKELEDADRSGSSVNAAHSSLGFHRNLCALAGNDRLLRAWEAHSALIKLAIRMRQAAEESTAVDPRLHDHRALLDTLMSKDPTPAVGMMVSHLEEIRDDLVRILEASAER
ncbi:GntR family transcriptional regulator [Nonomuraea antimicrobica]|uniref:GntR family transcriptional regulator n=1 Tax=Nonomuraea antimicrobica TaxID=561173 RepID=A0ABP7E5Y7_9ACTN